MLYWGEVQVLRSITGHQICLLSEPNHHITNTVYKSCARRFLASKVWRLSAPPGCISRLSDAGCVPCESRLPFSARPRSFIATVVLSYNNVSFLPIILFILTYTASKHHSSILNNAMTHQNPLSGDYASQSIALVPSSNSPTPASIPPTIYLSTQTSQTFSTIYVRNALPNAPTPTPSGSYTNSYNPLEETSGNSSYLIKVIVPIGIVASFFIIMTYWCFRYRGKRHARNDRLQTAGIPLNENFPPSVYPVPAPRPKTPPSAPAYQDPPGGVVLDPPPPVYAPGLAPPPPVYRDPN